MKDITITKVKLKSEGDKGIDITYSLPSKKDNATFIDEYTSKRKAPINDSLKESIDKLKSHLCAIYEYQPHKANNIEVESIKYDAKGFVITGDIFVLNQVFAPLETPLIESELIYPKYAEVKEIWEEIVKETKEYMDGKTASSEQIVIRFNKANPEFSIEDFKKLSKEEQKIMATKVLEDMGHFVMHSDDEIILDEEPKQEPVLDDWNEPTEENWDAEAEVEKAKNELLESSPAIKKFLEEEEELVNVPDTSGKKKLIIPMKKK